MRPQVPIVKSLASAICIGSGGSVGREGPIVQIGSALGSVLGQAIKLPERQLRLLVACGAAGGISATFNAPIAGVFFALELILGDFETSSFGLVVLSSVAADAIGRAVFGNNPFLRLPPFHFGSPVELLLYAGLGVIATGVGLGFVRILYAGEDLSDKLWGSRPEWLRPAVGGVLLGLLLLAIPEMYGVGYPVLQLAVAGHYVVLALLGPSRGEDPRHQPHHVDRRLRRSIRALSVHGSDARLRLRCGGPQPAPRHRRRRRSVRSGGHGRGVRRRRAGADHGGHHHLRADGRLPDHSSAHGRRRGRDRPQQRADPRHDLHAEASPSWHRHRTPDETWPTRTDSRFRGDGRPQTGIRTRLDDCAI